MYVYEMLFSFFTYAFLGWCTEVAFAAIRQRRFVNRGFLNGPVCPVYGTGVTIVVALMEPYTENLFLLYLLSASLVTALEYVTGLILEKLFHHRWWDYSTMPLNIKGYVCIPFSLIWGVACVAIVKVIYPFTYKLVSFLPVWLGVILLIGMCILFFTDICVTVGGILKWNRRLDAMQEIAAELHGLSDYIGENIYQNMMDGLEKQEVVKKRKDELKQKYIEMLEQEEHTARRLLKAFPQMWSKKHGEQLRALRKHLKRKYRNG